MKSVTKYKAADGEIFDSAKKCREYENLIKKVNEVMKSLGPIPRDKGCRWANGEGYLQHDLNDIADAKTALVVLGCEYLQIDKSPGSISFNWIGRYFDDSRVLPLYIAWGRLSNCDDKGREWGQMFYALHPEEGKQVPFTE